MNFPELRILGVMSGSSLDGLDLAICQFSIDSDSNISWEIKKSANVAFDKRLVETLNASYTSNSAFIYTAEQHFSNFCVHAIASFLGECEMNVDCLGFHGHTIFHKPEDGYTVQLGNGHCLSQKLGVDVIADFRSKDIALGGQGAPLAPIVEKYLFAQFNLFLNLGGIANISVHSSSEIRAFDITACNQALNHLAQLVDKSYDDKGNMARNGICNKLLLDTLSSLAYLSKKYPKSLSNTWVRREFIPNLDEPDIPIEDKMSTVVEHIGNEICNASRELSMSGKMMISGGGVHNDYLMEVIREKLAHQNITCETVNNEIAEYKEALLMALMAYLRVNELPNCLASVTGAGRDNCGGVIYKTSL